MLKLDLDSMKMVRMFLDLYHTEDVPPNLKSLAQSAVKDVCYVLEGCDCCLCEGELSLC